MNSPFTAQPFDALMAAQTSVGMTLTAVLWLRRLRPWFSTVAFLLAVAIVVVAPFDGVFLGAFGMTVGPLHAKHVVKLAAALVTAGALVTRRRVLAGSAVVSEVVLWAVTDYLRDSDWEVDALHLAVFGLLLGIHLRTLPQEDSSPPIQEPVRPRWLERQPLWVEDVAMGLGATLLASIVCWVVLHRWTDSADEWGNTFQGALFAKGRAYGDLPHCSESFRNFWIYPYMGRVFAEYTPGWPYFMTPFVALHLAWLAGPASLGLLAAGVARLTRRAAAGGRAEASPASSTHARVAGRFGAFVCVTGYTVLLNGASRYPHVFVAATYVWSVEALCALSEGPMTRHEQRRWGVVLGASAVLMLSARPADGAMLGIGLFLYAAYALARRRLEATAVAAAAIVFAAIGALTLVILRLQMGRWFKTGYSLVPVFYPWSDWGFSMPHPNEFKAGIPLGTGSYEWWPCSPAVGLAGLATLRGRARRIAFIFFAGFVPLLVLYTLAEFGRPYDFGYGHRYVLTCAVPMAVGTGVILAELWTAAARRRDDVTPLHAGAPIGIALVAIVLGLVRTVPLLYPWTYADVVMNHNRLHEALAKSTLHNAVVFGGPGLTNTDPMDLTENLPLDLYPHQDVLIALDKGPESIQCVRTHYPGRSYYRAVPGPVVTFVPF